MAQNHLPAKNDRFLSNSDDFLGLKIQKTDMVHQLFLIPGENKPLGVILSNFKFVHIRVFEL